MNNTVRIIITVALSAAVMILWSLYFSPKETAQNPAAPQQVIQEVVSQGSPVVNPPQQKEVVKIEESKLPHQEIEIQNELYSVKLSTDGGLPISWGVKAFYNEPNEKGGHIDLAKVNLGKEFKTGDFTKLSLGDSLNFPENPRYNIISSSDDSATFSWKGLGIEVIKKYNFRRDNYLLDLGVEIINSSGKNISLSPSVSIAGSFIPKDSSSFFSFLKQDPVDNDSPVYFLKQGVERVGNVFKIAEKEDVVGAISWVGLEERYFITSIIPRTISDSTKMTLQSTAVGEDKGSRCLKASLGQGTIDIPHGGKGVISYSVYAGPKDIERLKSVGVGLEKAIDYGWFSIVAIPMLYVLRFFNSLVDSWGISIILLTLFVKLVTNPISKKSMKSMKAMQKLQPELKKLQEKYKGNKQKINEETMRLFQAHKANPMGGCLPMLLQFPIYIALYKVLWNSVELFHVPFLWYPDLSAKDPYFLTPVVLGVFMFLQQKIMPSASADPMQAKMMMFMPVMFTAIMLFLPSGLVLYILISTASGVLQQFMYNRNIRWRDIFSGKVTLARLKGQQ